MKVLPGRGMRLGARRTATVKHTAKEYARGDAFTNTAESFFPRVKRAMYGTFHSVSKRHLHRYIAYMEFLHNARKLEDGARTVLAIKKSEGKRLRYKQPVAPPSREPEREAG